MNNDGDRDEDNDDDNDDEDNDDDDDDNVNDDNDGDDENYASDEESGFLNPDYSDCHWVALVIFCYCFFFIKSFTSLPRRISSRII